MGGLKSRLPAPGALFSKFGPLLSKMTEKLGPLEAKLKPLLDKLGPVKDRLAPLAHKMEEEFHHVVEEVEEHVHLPPAFEHVAEHIPEKRRTALFAGLGVLGLGFLIGLGIWLLGGDGPDGQEAQKAGPNTPSLSMPMPPRAGPGNALLNPSAPPPPGQEGTAPQAAADAPPPQPGGEALPAPGAPAPAFGTQPPSPVAGEAQAPGAPATFPPAAAPSAPTFEAPTLKDGSGAKLTSLSPVAGEPKLPTHTGPLSIPKLADIPAPTPPPQPPPPMPEAPQSALLKKTDAGQVPAIAPDGRESWKTYARPFDAGDKRPRVAVVIYDLGLIKEAGEAAIAKLPPEVTLSFSPYAPKLEDWVKRSHAAGHETLLDLPMDGRSFPMRDPGPSGLISSLSSTENQRKLETLLAKAQGYNGLTAVDGQRFLSASQQVDMLFRALKQSGLLFVDNGLSGDPTAQRAAEMLDLPYAKANIMIDERHFRTAVDIRLRKAEDDAQAKGRALVVIPARPLAMDRVAAWVKDLSTRGIALAPVSAVVGSKQP